MAFHFSLNGVLRLRESMEKAELQRLSMIASEVALTRAEIEALEKEMEAARRRAFDATVATGLTGAELHFEISREAALDALRSQFLEKLIVLEKKRKEQQARYFKSRMQREILSNLYKRQLDAYQVEQARREQQRIDELFLIRSHSSTE